MVVVRDDGIMMWWKNALILHIIIKKYISIKVLAIADEGEIDKDVIMTRGSTLYVLLGCGWSEIDGRAVADSIRYIMLQNVSFRWYQFLIRRLCTISVN